MPDGVWGAHSPGYMVADCLARPTQPESGGAMQESRLTQCVADLRRMAPATGRPPGAMGSPGCTSQSAPAILGSAAGLQAD
jgi:hypothetical protein